MDDLLASLAQKLDLSSPLSYVIVFVSGLLISFTPCIYPLIPVTIGFIGAKAGGSRLRGFILSMAYVLGIAITYSLLGAIASLTGKVFGSFTQTPLVYFITGNVFLFMGLSMLGLFSLPLPKMNMKVEGHSQARQTEVGQALFLGLVSGLVVGPCVAPALGAILVYVSTKQNILYGTTLLFTFAYGMGIILILAGTFAALVTAFPKSGAWMERIKKACGLILILAAEYFFIKMGGV